MECGETKDGQRQGCEYYYGPPDHPDVGGPWNGFRDRGEGYCQSRCDDPGHTGGRAAEQEPGHPQDGDSMIAVIADDFTGAAELAGIGHRRGWKVEVVTVVPEHTDAGVLVVATDTRSMDRAAAVREMEEITRRVQSLRPEW